MKSPKSKKNIVTLIVILFFIFIAFYFHGFRLNNKILKKYNDLASVIIIDRNDREICIKPNTYGNYMRMTSEFSQKLKELIVKKEDKYFYFHPGFNPVSIIKALFGYLELGERKASSTITQQLAKILLHTESQRNIKNKLRETIYAVSLELHNTKKQIIEMYLNSVYLGNSAQGIEEAARLYFSSSASSLNTAQIGQIIATIPSPNDYNPARKVNAEKTSEWAHLLKIENETSNISDIKSVRLSMENYSHASNTCFEYSSIPGAFSQSKKITSDSDLTDRIRAIAYNTISTIRYKNANNAAIVVLKLPENEILSIVGSIDPNSSRDGDKINMALEPRAIGSTIKPFI